MRFPDYEEVRRFLDSDVGPSGVDWYMSELLAEATARLVGDATGIACEVVAEGAQRFVVRLSQPEGAEPEEIGEARAVARAARMVMRDAYAAPIRRAWRVE